jgi:hypothetical protein
MSMDKFTKANGIDDMLGTSAAVHAGWDEALLRDGRRLWIEPTVDAGEQSRTTTYIVPIIVDGTYRGYVGMGLDFQRVIDQVASIRFYESGYGFLTDGDGNELDNPTVINRPEAGQEDIVIYVTATNDEGEGHTPTSVTERVVIPAKQPAQQQCAKPDGGYVNGQDFHGVTVTLTNNETAEGAQLHYTVKKDGVVITEDAIYDGPFALTQNGEYEIDFWATAPGMLDSTHGGLKFTIDETTGLSELAAGKNVASVRYFNMAGQEMQEANGMTIVVTTYTDGTSSAVKVMK